MSITLLSIILISCDKQVSVSEHYTDSFDNKIIIETLPAGASIFLNGDNTGKVSPDSIPNLEPGDYIITLKRNLFLDTTAIVNIEESEIEKIYINYFNDSRNFGKIECVSDPSNAEIFLDDSSTGLYTPAILDFIWPGQHELKYVYPEHRADSLNIELHASTTEKVDIALQDTSRVVDYHSMNSEFPTNMTWCVAIDKEQHQWVGTMDKGLVVLMDGHWLNYNRTNSPLPSNYINYIAIDTENTKWIGTQQGLVVVDANNNWSVYTTFNSDLPNNFVNSIAFDSKGNTWLAASQPAGQKSLVKFNNGMFTCYEINEIINTIAVDKADRIWVGLEQGIRILDDGIWQTDMTDTMRIATKTITALASDLEGRIYIGTNFYSYHGRDIPRGLYVYDNGALIHKPTADPTITHIHAAENGNIWVCTYGFYLSLYTDPNVCILYKIDPDDMIIEYTQNNSDIPGFFLVQSATQSNGDLWIASRRNGIIKFKRANL